MLNKVRGREKNLVLSLYGEPAFVTGGGAEGGKDFSSDSEDDEFSSTTSTYSSHDSDNDWEDPCWIKDENVRQFAEPRLLSPLSLSPSPPFHSLLSCTRASRSALLLPSASPPSPRPNLQEATRGWSSWDMSVPQASSTLAFSPTDSSYLSRGSARSVSNFASSLPSPRGHHSNNNNNSKSTHGGDKGKEVEELMPMLSSSFSEPADFGPRRTGQRRSGGVVSHQSEEVRTSIGLRKKKKDEKKQRKKEAKQLKSSRTEGSLEGFKSLRLSKKSGSINAKMGTHLNKRLSHKRQVSLGNLEQSRGSISHRDSNSVPPLDISAVSQQASHPSLDSFKRTLSEGRIRNEEENVDVIKGGSEIIDSPGRERRPTGPSYRAAPDPRRSAEPINLGSSKKKFSLNFSFLSSTSPSSSPSRGQEPDSRGSRRGFVLDSSTTSDNSPRRSSGLRDSHTERKLDPKDQVDAVPADKIESARLRGPGQGHTRKSSVRELRNLWSGKKTAEAQS